MAISLPTLISPVRRVGSATIDFSRRVAVMGIVNRTPDSFHDQGRTFALELAVQATLAAGAAGADLVDIGGVPFGVDKPDVSEAEELDRVLPVVEAVRAVSTIPISIDTYRTEVARQAIAAGADVINDTSGLHDETLADLVAAHAGVSLIVTHSLASPPRTPVPHPRYGDVVAEVVATLADRVARARAHGVPDERIIIDPGHDLNKNTRHSLELTRRLPEVAALGYPVLAAVSNKTFIGEALGAPQGHRLEGTLAAVAICILGGARLVRVHDVAAAVAATRFTEAVLGWREPVYERHNI